MQYKDYYAILGVKRDATQKEVRSAYRKLARKYHPDVNPGDAAGAARFTEINEAYEALSDEEKRKKYDRFGADWEQYERMGAATPGGPDFAQWANQQGYAQPGRGYSYPSSGTMPGGAGFSDFFETMFGGMGGGAADPYSRVRTSTRTVTRRGEDVAHPIEVTLEEAYAGATRRLQLQTSEGPERTPLLKTIEVKIPAGVQTGSVIRLMGRGGAGTGGAPAGDLRLEVNVVPHPRYERKGDNLHLPMPVPLYTAVLGGEVRVPTLRGTNLALRIAPETQNGRVIRLTGQGMPRLNSPDTKGDLLVRVEVQVPQGLGEEEQQLFGQLQRIYEEREAEA